MGTTRATLTIALGDSLSSVARIERANAEGVFLPAGFEGTSLSFQAGVTKDGPFSDVVDEMGEEAMVRATPGKYVGFDPIAAELRGIRFLRIRAGSTVLGTTQTAERVLTVLAKGG